MYTLTNKETGEVLNVKAHTVGDDFVAFADASLTGEAWENATELYTFANPEDNGAFADDATLDSTGVYTIKLTEE